jgi:hypothetical protein
MCARVLHIWHLIAKVNLWLAFRVLRFGQDSGKAHDAYSQELAGSACVSLSAWPVLRCVSVCNDDLGLGPC